jgi:uncharacterized protein
MSRRNFIPQPSAATGPYWRATREQQLLLQFCPSCERYVHHPKEVCPHCLTRRLEWRESAGRGKLHAFSVHHRPFEVMEQADCPYVVAFVDLDEGVRFLSNVVGAHPKRLSVGASVSLSWTAVGGGYYLPVFTLAEP